MGEVKGSLGRFFMPSPNGEIAMFNTTLVFVILSNAKDLNESAILRFTQNDNRTGLPHAHTPRNDNQQDTACNHTPSLITNSTS